MTLGTTLVDDRPSARARAAPIRVLLPAWLGVVALSMVTLWFGIVGLRALLDAGDLGAAISVARGRMIGPGILVFVVCLLAAERRWPAQRRALGRAELVDAIYLGLFALAVVPALTVVETGCALELERHAHFLLVSRLAFAPRVAVVAVILVGVDAMNWLCHVANHRLAALWRLHALHHSQEEMGVLTTFRTHPLVHAAYLPTLLPVLVLGASGTVPDLALVVYGCLITLPHANLGWSFGRLGRVVVSPAYHRLHHAAAPLGSTGVVNFGFVLVCWDRLARHALYPTQGASPVATGIAGRPVPIEQSRPAAGSVRVVLAQLAQPFRVRAGLDG